ncbi:unnamed protein product, partial [Allacma fusca]
TESDPTSEEEQVKNEEVEELTLKDKEVEISQKFPLNRIHPLLRTSSMESNTELSWLDFILNRSLLVKHLQKPDPDPSPNTLISQFLLNADKWTEAPSDPNLVEPTDSLLKASRSLKNRTLKLMAIQVAAHLDWDLDSLAKLQIGLQNFLMNHILALSEESKNDKFLHCLYHRWVLRTIQSNKVTRVHFRPLNPMVLQGPDPVQIAETIVKTLNPETSVKFLLDALESTSKKSILIPSVDTFAGTVPNWSLGNEINVEAFKSMIHVDLGVYLLYEGKNDEAKKHFKAQNLPVENFPYFKISEAKLDGFLASVGLKKVERKPILLPNLVQSTTLEISKWLQLGHWEKIEGVFQKELEDGVDMEIQELDSDEELLPLDPNKIPVDPDPLVGQEQLEMFNLVRKLFMEWELPLPLQHAIEKVPAGALKDFVQVLVAKSKQHYNLKNFSQARQALDVAKKELDDSLLQGVNAWGFNQYNVRKLGQMLDWEVLLIDITELFSTWTPASPNTNQDLVKRCRECIRFMEDPSSEVNPRSEIVEFILMAFINLGEFKFVIKFEDSRKRWPFVEFLGLLARACRDVTEKKDVSPNYRELWSTVLPVCMNSTGAKLPRVGKEGILPNKSSLLWVLDRACSLTVISLFVSLLSRLHNHILDDVALLIQADLLHVWPNIIDDVTITTGSSIELKSRISGSSKLNIHQVQDFLFHLLQLALIRSEETLWLKCLGDVHLASGSPALAMKSYVEYLAISTDFFEKTVCPCWGDNALFRKMIKCCEGLQCFTQAMLLCQFLTDVDYNVAFGMAQEKVSSDASDSLYGFIWDLTILEFLVNLHTKRNETKKRQEAVKLLGLLELNSNNNEEIQREAMILRKSQFMRTLARMYIFV